MRASSGSNETIVIGLVNNMPPSAFHATEAQFANLLQASAASLPVPPRVVLHCFAATPDAGGHYGTLNDVFSTDLDGLIVTGSPPGAADIADEPVLPMLGRLADWAADHTRAVIWSCLAAHAAVHHLDGLKRQRLAGKLSGIYACRDATGCAARAQWPVPHSRYHDLDIAALERAGYRILSRGPGAQAIAAQQAGKAAHATADGADSFERLVGRSNFLFLQGHPEYDAATLMREYRRDVRCVLAGAVGSWPTPPLRLFGCETLAALAELQSSAAGLAMPDALAALDGALRDVASASWHARAVVQFGGWLAGLGGLPSASLAAGAVSP